MMKQDIVAAVREMLERHWDVYEIAAKLNLDISIVKAVIDLIT